MGSSRQCLAASKMDVITLSLVLSSPFIRSSFIVVFFVCGKMLNESPGAGVLHLPRPEFIRITWEFVNMDSRPLTNSGSLSLK